jgi:esterase/lipase
MVSHLNAKGVMRWIDNKNTERPNINYQKHPLEFVFQLKKIMNKTERLLYKIKDPILIIQGDYVVNPQSAILIYDKVKSKDKKLTTIPRDRHNILSEGEEFEVFDSVYRLIKRIDGDVDTSRAFSKFTEFIFTFFKRK